MLQLAQNYLDRTGASRESRFEVKFRFLVSPLSILLIAEVNSQVSLAVDPTLSFSLSFGKAYIGSKTRVKEKRINCNPKAVF